MIQPTNGNYTIPENVMDSILIHQKDKILSWLNDLESTRDPIKAEILKSKVLGAILVLTDLWAELGYSYKAEEISKRITKLKKHK